MKKIVLNLGFVFIAVAVICLFVKNSLDYCRLADENNKLKGELNCLKNSTNGEMQFIWNDDLEAIPADGQNIKIELTDDNKVYLTTADN